MKWSRITIQTVDGPRDGIAPQIISASRSTDIPAFYAKGFARRLKAGYCKWVNPFNNQPQYVSFERARAFVFWTKNAEPMIPYLSELDDRGVTYYFQFTVNDYETEKFEPGVPSLAERLETFKRLSRQIGSNRVIWRFDPLMLTDSLTVEGLIERVRRIGEELQGHTEKLVFSFADISAYAKVKHNLARCGVPGREFSVEEMRTFARRLTEVTRGWGLTLATCGENIGLSEFGVEHNRCIDDELLLRLAPNDTELRTVLGRGPEFDADLFGSRLPKPKSLKDPGQREACGCVVSKDIGMYNTCKHLCVYCYANTSKNAVDSARARLAGDPEVIVGDNSAHE